MYVGKPACIIYPTLFPTNTLNKHSTHTRVYIGRYTDIQHADILIYN